MTKIAYVGNVSDDDSSPAHSTENHVKQALRNLGHEVVPILERGLDWSTVPQLVKGADMMLWTRTGSFDSDRQQQRAIIKGLDIPTAGFHLDRWWGLKRENTEGGPADPNRTPFFDCTWVFTADGDPSRPWEEHGINHQWSPPAILSDEAKRVGTFRREYSADLAFVGNLRKYAHPEWGPYRLRLFNFLAKTYKGRFKLWEGGIRGQDLADLYASVKVLVGDSCLAGGAKRYWSDRVPETLGRGGFLIHPEVEGLMTAFPDLPTYPLGDFDVLRRKIETALLDDDGRREMAERNRDHVLGMHTYERRMSRVLAAVLG